MKDYEATLHEHMPKNVNFNAIRSKNHKIYSTNQSKVGFTSYDNKRYWFNDTESLPYDVCQLAEYIYDYYYLGSPFFTGTFTSGVLVKGFISIMSI